MNDGTAQAVGKAAGPQQDGLTS